MSNLSGAVEFYRFKTGRYVGQVPQESGPNVPLPVQLFNHGGVQLLTGGTCGQATVWDLHSKKRTAVLSHIDESAQTQSLGDIIQCVSVRFTSFGVYFIYNN